MAQLIETDLGERLFNQVSSNDTSYRRFPLRVGSNATRSESTGVVASLSPGNEYQLPGAEGSSNGSPLVRGLPGGTKRRADVRQHHSSGVPSKRRRNSFSNTQPGGTKDSRMVRVEWSFSTTTICQRQAQCSCGFSQQAKPSNTYGMDAGTGGGRQAHTSLASNSRRLCNLSELQAAGVFQSFSGRDGSGHGCSATRVGQSMHICIPTPDSRTEGPEQDTDQQERQSHSHSSPMATKRVVSRPSGDVNRSSKDVASQTGPFEPTPLVQKASEPPSTVTSRLETVRRWAKHRGFSSRAADRIANSRRKTSLRLYQSYWSIYRVWCHNRGFSASKASIPRMADFLIYLGETKGLSVSALKGYRAMLGSVFKYRLPDLSTNMDLHDIIRSFDIKRPRRVVGLPNWDLDLVLKYLSGPPFEPLRQADFRALTKKTTFLVSLATAKRLGELQSLSKVVAFSGRKGRDAILSYLPEFLAKTEFVSKPLPREFTLKSLTDIVGRQESERLLCPVRALKFYLDRTKTLENRPRSLFVSCKDNGRGMSKNALSFFLRETIKEAHMTFQPEQYWRQDIRAHSIRAVATSLNFMRNHSLQTVIEAATWRGNSIFASHYLKDVKRTYEACSSLGPLIAGGGPI